MGRPPLKVKAGDRLSAATVQSILEALRRLRILPSATVLVQQTPAGQILTARGRGGGQPRIVKPTSTTPDANGYLPGKVQEYSDGEGWLDGDDCYIINAN